MNNSEHLKQLPKKKFQIMNIIWLLIFIVGFILSVQSTDTHISDLFKNWGQFCDIFVEMSHPDWNYFSTVVG